MSEQIQQPETEEQPAPENRTPSLDLDAIEARAKAATPGPWWWPGPYVLTGHEGRIRLRSVGAGQIRRPDAGIGPLISQG